jgi:hypothetical protein
MISGLNANEQAVYSHLANAPRSLVKLSFESVATPDSFRDLLRNLLEAWRDNPRGMLNALGFNLPSVLKMKFYSLEDVNQILGENRHVYRAMAETTATSKESAWLALAGYLKAGNLVATVYIDSSLNRYLRLSNGQLFECSNADLVGMPEIDRVNIRAYLLGIID